MHLLGGCVRRRDVVGAVRYVPAVEQVALGGFRLGCDGLPFGNFQHLAGAFALLKRNRAALGRVGLCAHGVGIFTVHHGHDARVAVHAVLAHVLTIHDGAPLRVGFAPFNQLVGFLRIVGACMRAGREREDIAIGRAHHAAFHRHAIAQHVGALSWVNAYRDDFVGLAKLRHQMAVGFGRKHVHRRLRHFNAVFEPAHERVVRRLGGHHLRFPTAFNALHVRGGVAAGNQVGGNTRHFHRCGNRNVFLKHGRHGGDLGCCLGDGHGCRRRHGVLNPVELPAHEVIAQVGNGRQHRFGALVVHATAAHHAANLGVGNGNNLYLVVALGFVGLAARVIPVEQVFYLSEKLLAGGRQFLGILCGLYFNNGFGGNRVHQLAETVRGCNARNRENRGYQRRLQRLERLVFVICPAEMCHQLGIFSKQKRIRARAFSRCHHATCCIGYIVEHITRLRYGHHRHLRAHTVQARE